MDEIKCAVYLKRRSVTELLFRNGRGIRMNYIGSNQNQAHIKSV